MLASFHLPISHLSVRLPRNHSGKESTCQCQKQRKHRFNHSWRKRQPTPVFSLESLMDRRAWDHGLSKNWIWLSMHTHTHTHTHTPLCLVWRNVYWGLLPIFSTRFFVFCCCSYWTVWAVCIFSKLSSCWVASFVNIFSHSVGWLEICLWFPLLCKSLKIWLDTFSLFFYYFISIAVGDWTKKTLVQFMSNSFAYDLS